MKHSIEAGLGTMLVGSMILSACAPAETSQPANPDSSNPGSSQEGQAPVNGVGTAVPEFTLVPGGARDLKDIFGIDPEEVESVGISCNQEKGICVTSALDAEGKIVSQVILFNSHAVVTEKGVDVDGFHFGGTVNSSDTNNDGTIDQILFVGDGKANVEAVNAAMFAFSDAERVGLDGVLDEARNQGKGVDINITNDGSILTIFVKVGENPEDSWGIKVPINNIAPTSSEASKFVNPQINEQGHLVQESVPVDWVEMGDNRFVSPDFVAIHEAVAGAGTEFTLMPDGTLQAADGTPVDGFVLTADGQKVLVTANNATYECTFDPGTISGKTFEVVSVDGKTLKYDGIRWAEAEPAKIDRPLRIDDRVDEVNQVSTIGGAIVNGAFMTDQSVAGKAPFVNMPDSLGAELILRAAATASLTHGPKAPLDKVSDADVSEFGRTLAKVQSGEPGFPCSEVQATIYAWDQQNPSAEQQPMTVEFFCGAGQVSPGARRIDKIEIVYAKAFGEMSSTTYLVSPDWGRFTMTSRMGSGYETVVDGNTLRFVVGVNYQYGNNTRWSIASATSELFRWIVRNDGGSVKLTAQNSDDDAGLEYISKGFAVTK